MVQPISPFNKIDNLHLRIFGYDLAYVFKPNGWRKYALFFVTISGLLWVFFGYEGMFDQVEWSGKYLLSFLTSQSITFSDVVAITSWRYGIGTHLSAALIYGLMFYMISHYYEKIGVVGSLNLTMSILLTLFSVAVFEFTWMASYYTAQQQTWVLTPLFKQVSILYQNILFFTCGLVFIVFIYLSKFQTRYPQIRFRVTKKLGCLVGLSLLFWAVWYFYPLPTTQLIVNASTEQPTLIPVSNFNTVGWQNNMWYSCPNFPQTMYTVDLHPYDNMAIGVPFFVEDNVVHSVNLFMKIVWTYTVYYFGKVIVRQKMV